MAAKEGEAVKSYGKHDLWGTENGFVFVKLTECSCGVVFQEGVIIHLQNLDVSWPRPFRNLRGRLDGDLNLGLPCLRLLPCRALATCSPPSKKQHLKKFNFHMKSVCFC